MKLYELFQTTCYDQIFYIYLTNSYDQNLPIAKGKREEIMIDAEVDILWHIGDDVESIEMSRIDRGMVVKLRDKTYEQPLEVQYNEKYVRNWNRLDINSRPYRFSVELESWGK